MTSYKLKLLQFFHLPIQKSLPPENWAIYFEIFIYNAKFQIFKIFCFKRYKDGLTVHILFRRSKKGGHIFDVTCNVIAATLACVLVIVMCSTNTAFENKTSLRHSVKGNEANANLIIPRIHCLWWASTLIKDYIKWVVKHKTLCI